MSDDFTTAAWGQRGQGPSHVVVDNPATSNGGSAVTDGGGSLTVDDGGGSLTVDGAVTVANFPATQPVSLATNTPDVTDRPARQLGHVTVDAAPTTAVTGPLTDSQLRAAAVPVSLAVAPTTTVTGTVTANTGSLPALTKGTQGTTGIAVQELKDAGRTPVILSAMAVTSVTTEAMFTLNKWAGGAVTSGTSYTVSAGKTLRVQTIQYGCRFATNSTTVTFANTKVNFRSGNATNSPLIYGDSKMSASNAATPNSDLTIPDGLEFPAGTILGFSHLDSAATLLLDVVLVGYEY